MDSLLRNCPICDSCGEQLSLDSANYVKLEKSDTLKRFHPYGYEGTYYLCFKCYYNLMNIIEEGLLKRFKFD